jgi:hypothetical protein
MKNKPVERKKPNVKFPPPHNRFENVALPPNPDLETKPHVDVNPVVGAKNFSPLRPKPTPCRTEFPRKNILAPAW